MLTDGEAAAIVSVLLTSPSVVGATGPEDSSGPWRFHGGIVKVERLSASSIGCFEACEARFQATYVEKGIELSGDAAVAGTCAHEALEEVIVSGLHLDEKKFNLKNVKAIYDRHADSHGLSADQIAAGHAMMKNWVDFHLENGFLEVLATESKKTFMLTHPRLGSIPVTYIFDRADWNPEWNEIEIIDYKTFASPMSADELRRKVQVRVYGVAAAIEYGHRQPKAIWVKYWLLRYGVIGVQLTREDNLATWRYLQDVWERIEASDGTIESVGPECRWCIRKANCDSLRRHVNAGGVLGLTPSRAAQELADTKNRINALNALKTDLEDFMSDFLDSEGATEWEFEGGVSVSITPTKRRAVDGYEVGEVLGPELIAKYGTIGVTTLDKILKDEPSLTDDQRTKLKKLITKKAGAQLNVKVPSPMDDI